MSDSISPIIMAPIVLSGMATLGFIIAALVEKSENGEWPFFRPWWYVCFFISVTAWIWLSWLLYGVSLCDVSFILPPVLPSTPTTIESLEKQQ